MAMGSAGSLLAACGNSTPTTATQSGAGPALKRDPATLVVAMDAFVTDFDPASYFLLSDIVPNFGIYDSLMRMKGSSATETKPWLAQRISTNSDKSVWTFTLRPGVKYSDGTSFNRNTLKAAYTRTITAQLGAGSTLPKLAARVRLLQAGDTNKNDPNDALSVAVAALRSRSSREVVADDHAAVLKVWSKRHRDLARNRNQVACRLHACGNWTAWSGSLRCARPRSPRWPATTGRCRCRCPARRISRRLLTRIIRVSGWSAATTRSWPPNGPASARTC
jgi:Bacterial extracellular solute-binding proteins, family 5 Middle